MEIWKSLFSATRLTGGVRSVGSRVGNAVIRQADLGSGISRDLLVGSSLRSRVQSNVVESADVLNVVAVSNVRNWNQESNQLAL